MENTQFWLADMCKCLGNILKSVRSLILFPHCPFIHTLWIFFVCLYYWMKSIPHRFFLVSFSHKFHVRKSKCPTSSAMIRILSYFKVKHFPASHLCPKIHAQTCIRWELPSSSSLSYFQLFNLLSPREKGIRRNGTVLYIRYNSCPVLVYSRWWTFLWWDPQHTRFWEPQFLKIMLIPTWPLRAPSLILPLLVYSAQALSVKVSCTSRQYLRQHLLWTDPVWLLSKGQLSLFALMLVASPMDPLSPCWQRQLQPQSVTSELFLGGGEDASSLTGPEILLFNIPFNRDWRRAFSNAKDSIFTHLVFLYGWSSIRYLALAGTFCIVLGLQYLSQSQNGKSPILTFYYIWGLLGGPNQWFLKLWFIF